MNTENPQSNYRYERKYRLDISDYKILVDLLFLEGMKLHHPSRFINNIYFDTLNFDAYFENVEGESKRNKYRLRWYGDRFNIIEPVFEIKMKKDQVNRKETLKISEVEFKNLHDISKVYSHVLNYMETNGSKLFFEMMDKSPTILNGYQRDYFLSKDGETRLTIDRNIFFYNSINYQEYCQDDVIIVEVKYKSNVIPKINFDKFKLVLGKNSKYVSGIDLTKLK